MTKAVRRTGRLFECKKRGLTLRELLCAACFAQTDFLTLNFTCVAGNKACFRQLWLERCIIVYQCTGDAMTYGTRLTGLAAAIDVDHDVEAFYIIGQLQRLTDHHQASFTGKILIGRLAVDNDLASTRFDEHACYFAFATAGSVILVTEQIFRSQCEWLRLL